MLFCGISICNQGKGRYSVSYFVRGVSIQNKPAIVITKGQVNLWVDNICIHNFHIHVYFDLCISKAEFTSKQLEQHFPGI